MLKISTSLILILSTLAPSSAQEVNTSNFSGTLNTTVSSGVTIRTARDCSNLDGYSYTGPVGTYVDGSGSGCATSLTDAYGNSTTKALSRSSGLGDDGNMNFDDGAVVSAKQKVFTSLSGTTSSGIGIDLSFSGFIDPALDINSPNYAPLTKGAENDFESGFDILNAYVYGSSELGDGNYIDWTIGRQVTNWGEATFIPIGMNGLTTNALDLTKLRGPGSSIREALVPTGQITLATSLGDGYGLEVFYQLEHTPVVLDPAGSFYGNELVGSGSNKMITSGNYGKENVAYDGCSFSDVGTDATLCTASRIAAARTTTGIQTHDTTYHLATGLKGLTQTQVAAAQGVGIAKSFGTAADLSTHAASAWTDAYTGELNSVLGSATVSGVAAGGAAMVGTGATGVDKTFYRANTQYKLTTIAGLIANTYSDDATGAQTTAAFGNIDTSARLIDDALNTYAAVSIRKTDNFITNARDDGQFGLRLSGYSDAGSGFDWSVNYSRFHSKAPYTRIKGKGGIYAGDIYGALAAAGDTAEGSRTAAQNSLVKAVQNVAYSAGVCDAAMGSVLAGMTFANADSDGTYWNAVQAAYENYDGTTGSWDTGISSQQKGLSDKHNWEDTINGKQVHNSAKCYATATAFTNGKSLAFSKGDIDAAVDVHASLNDTAEVLGAAITPLNYARYELFYPEDLDALGFSFNTNINGTALQGEITYRPNFPLATSGGDQVSQIGDVTGAYDLLDMFAFDTVTRGVADNTNNNGTDLADIVNGTAVSSTFYDPTVDPTASAADAAEYLQQGIRMRMVGLATISAEGVVSVTGTTLPNDQGKITVYKNWMASKNSSSSAVLGLAGVRKGIFDGAYVKSCTLLSGGTPGDGGSEETVCKGHTLGAGNYNTAYYTGDYALTVGAAYEAGTVLFNRSSLPALTKANTVNDYYSTPFIEKDVWSLDVGTTTAFNASHPITASLGADSSAFLTEIGMVSIRGMDNAKDGYVARSGYQEGIGNEKCLGPFGALVGGGYNFGGAVGGITHLGAGQVDALFGNGGYCESQSGADDFSMTYRLIGTATYNNVNNSPWSISPTVVLAHDVAGYGPASLGGFVEDKMTMSFGLSAKKGSSMTMGLNYTSNFHGPEVDASTDKDTVTASVSYAF
jgi:hypothetical protein